MKATDLKKKDFVTVRLLNWTANENATTTTKTPCEKNMLTTFSPGCEHKLVFLSKNNAVDC